MGHDKLINTARIPGTIVNSHPMDDTLADPIAGRLIDGRYAVSARIAHGGMATVYLATDTRLDRLVALKVMHAELARDDDFVRRFIDEAKSVARLSHQNVVAVYDQGADGPFLYLAMEYVPGRTLKELLREHVRFSPAAALDIISGVLDGLGAAHASGIVHRDVKPENVLIAADGPGARDGRVKVADFGLARAAAAGGHTRSGMIIGTVAYLAPEQVDGSAPTGPRSDVYAVGVLLYELLTGRQPFTGETPISVAYQHVNSRVPAPSALVPDMPVAVDELVLAATDRDAARRPADAWAFLREVRQVQDALSFSRTASGGEHSGLTGLIGVGVQGLGEAPWLDLETGYGTGAVSGAGAISGAGAGPGVQRSGRHAGGATDEWASDFAAGGAGFGGAGGNHTLIVNRDDADRYQRGRDPFLGRWLFSRRLLYLALALAILVGSGVGGWWLTSGRYAIIPSVAGDSVHDATLVLTAHGFQVAGLTRVNSNSVPVGSVTGTNPSGRVSKGAKVTLLVCAGPFTSVVPPLKGATRTAALADLLRLHLTANVQYIGSTLPMDSVVRTDPKAGTAWPQTKAVTLFVVGGLPLPDFASMQFHQAQQLAQQDGITLQVAGGQSGGGQPDGGAVITGQTPKPGSVITKGEIVSVTIQQDVQVPDVQGFKVQDARLALEALGFKVVVVGPDFLGYVWNQDPNGQSTAPSGSTVHLYTNPFSNGNGNGNGNGGGGGGGGGGF